MSNISWSWSKRIAIAVSILAVLVAVSGLVFQSVSTYREAHLYPPPGKLVDIGGYRLHINCLGSGSPTVILESGLGDSSLVWQLVQPIVAKTTRICSYDRAGLGWSDPGPQPRTSSQIAKELDLLLTRAGIPAPYILVGHSMGGYIVRVYAAQHPEEVAGIVLVDSSHEDQDNRLHAFDELDREDRRQRKVEMLTMVFGLPRLRHQCGVSSEDVPPELAALAPEYTALDCRLTAIRTVDAEHLAGSESARQVAAAGTLGSLPLIVLSHEPGFWGVPKDIAKLADPQWDKMQDELSRLSTEGVRIVAKRSGHYVQVDRPDAVIEAIDKLVGNVKASQLQRSSAAPNTASN